MLEILEMGGLGAVLLLIVKRIYWTFVFRTICGDAGHIQAIGFTFVVMVWIGRIIERIRAYVHFQSLLGWRGCCSVRLRDSVVSHISKSRESNEILSADIFKCGGSQSTVKDFLLFHFPK